MKRILVTGGAGFIGSHLVQRLVREGDFVRVLDDLSTGSLEYLTPCMTAIQFIQGDVCDETVLNNALEDIDTVFHLAAIASVAQSFERFVVAHQVNLSSVVQLLHLCERAGVKRVIFASSAAVYGSQKGMVDENAQIQPLSPYALQKATAEQYGLLFSSRGTVEFTALRLFNIYGPGQDRFGHYGAVVPLLLSKAMKNEKFIVFGDGKQSRDFLFVEDLVELFVRAAIRPEVKNEIVNAGSGTAVSIIDLIECAEKVVGKKIEVKFAPARMGDVRHSCANIKKTVQLLGFTPTTALEDGLKQTMQWLLAGERVHG